MPDLKDISCTPDPSDSTRVVLTRKCPFCGKEQTMSVKQNIFNMGMSAIRCGSRIQDAFPTWTADQREFILTGICPACWDNM